ncbi:MAG: prolipoprotein diacylglyceryl transferase [Anaerolineae bacterium]|nr:prolipoprotein diacylglyceryl transferase [Anaerolineae bacterium]
MTVDRLGIHFGSFIIYFYAIIILIGVLAACFLTSRRAKEAGQDPDLIWDLATWLLIAGIIGARLWHILLPSASQVANGITTQYYLTHPLDAINIRAGGMGIPGGVIGGALALYIFTRIKKINFLTWVDLIAPGLILAQAIGRWGNFVNQELYGAPTSLPWAIYIEPAYRLPEFAAFSYYHPLFLYECVWNLAVFFLLLWVEKQFAESVKTGDIFLLYLIGYPVGRFLLEFLRLDTAQVMGFDFNQYSMGAVALVALVVLMVRHARDTEAAALETEEPVAVEEKTEE